MTTGRIGVAISTTGDEHRLSLLEASVNGWIEALPESGLVSVTVDGTEEAAERVRALLYPKTRWVYRVGQKAWTVGTPTSAMYGEYAEGFTGRLGVATNKNTGLELLMADPDVEHLFLSDDDTWPLYPQSLHKHTNLVDDGISHSMVCWGKHRLTHTMTDAEKVAYNHAVWTWPRGVMLYQHRSVVETVGGMVEAFGPGGHEHAEYSQRIRNAGLTPAPFLSPASYATRDATGAAVLWHCEDMRRPGERPMVHKRRREALTSIQRGGADWAQIDKMMHRMEGSSRFMPYTAAANERASATLCTAPSRGAGAVEGDEK